MTDPTKPHTVEGLPDDIRALGWTVAVHNDYRLNGEAHTFWVFTKDGRAIKGEGRTDAEALNHVRSSIPVSPGFRVKPLEWVERVAETEFGAYWILPLASDPAFWLQSNIRGGLGNGDRYHTEEAAQAAAQADFDQRIGTLPARSEPFPRQCRRCKGAGTEADYVGADMRCVEVSCSACKGSGVSLPTSSTGGPTP